MESKESQQHDDDEPVTWKKTILLSLQDGAIPVMFVLTIVGGALYLKGQSDDNEVMEEVGGWIGALTVGGGVLERSFRTCANKLLKRDATQREAVERVIDEDPQLHEDIEQAEQELADIAEQLQEGGDQGHGRPSLERFYTARDVSTV